MKFGEVHLVGGLATLALLNLPPLTGLAQKDVITVAPWFSRKKTAS
jgi:hypothetical protein